MKRANEVFPTSMIDTGFPADTRVYLCNDRRRHLNEPNAA